MKNFLKHLSRIILLSIIMMFSWAVSMEIAHSLFPAEIKSTGFSPLFSILMLMLVGIINSAILYIMIRNSKWNFLKTAIAVFVVIFGVQFFLSLIEAFVFNDAIKMPGNLLLSTLLGGLLFSLVYSPLATWITGKATDKSDIEKESFHNSLWTGTYKIAVLSLLIYPLLYFLAGYFIAWQFEAVRVFYTGSSEMKSFFSMMADNFSSGLVFLAMSRGVIWTLIGIMIYNMVDLNTINKGLLIGGLFALIMNSQHLIPNPYMPRMVSFAHFIETSSSNFIWGYLIAWLWSLPLEFGKKRVLV